MGSVTIAVVVDVILRDGCAPRGATLELDVVDVDASIYDIRIDALAAGGVVLVDRVCIGTELLTVGDAR